jgi:hypothetical protein
MRKSTVIANCLVDARAFSDIADAEAAVRAAFRNAFPDQNCSDWNGDVDAVTAAAVRDRYRDSPAPPSVRQMIDELRYVPGVAAPG